MLSPGPQNTCGPVGQNAMNPQVPCRGYRAGPVFHGRDENHTAPPEAKVRLSAGLSSPLQYPGVGLTREADHPRSPATTELFNHLGDFSLGDERVQPRGSSHCFHQGMRDGRIEEILEVLLPPPDNVDKVRSAASHPHCKQGGAKVSSTQRIFSATPTKPCSCCFLSDLFVLACDEHLVRDESQSEVQRGISEQVSLVLFFV
ncbi:hypothetical protein XENORESO_018917 [Xenotaenia resolanae]|uniref:Uncharacterized protein n=1 Tax=Xenotaenia resolanae TaxID=208358 RepID=A0ABV0WNV2_9TELE